jgi:DNA-3-methyladenine glycosylase II
MPERHEIAPRGAFSLRAAAEFGFGPNEGRPPPFDGVMRLAFGVDGGQGYAGAVLRQPEADGPVQVELTLRAGADAEAALAQTARIVSLDHDGTEFARVGDRDPILGALQRAHPGQRPVLFQSPYEAAAWSIISSRRPASQGAQVRQALSEERGETFELDGRTLFAFPQPERLQEIGDEFPGLNSAKVQRLRALARAAIGGDLDVERLQGLGSERALEEVQRLNGIGPFYAGLIVVRGTGFADAMLHTPERKGLAHTARFYGLDGPLGPDELAALAERWRPFRTWAIVLIRLAGDRGTRIDPEAA